MLSRGLGVGAGVVGGPSSEVGHYFLPRSLRCVAGASKFGAEEKAGHSGRDDRVRKIEILAKSTGRIACATKRRVPHLDVEEPVVGVGGVAGLDGGQVVLELVGEAGL